MTETAKAPVRCGLSGTALKYIACITMLIDHIGASCIEAGILLPALAAGAASCGGIPVSTLLAADRVLRYIGRLAFPIFCFLAVEGFLHTHDVKKYVRRLLLFGLLSEVPFDLAFFRTPFAPQHQNVYWTLFFGLCALGCLRHCGERSAPGIFSALALAVLAELLRTDYGAIGVLLIVVLVFGTKKLKNIGSDLGGAVKGFKDGMKDGATDADANAATGQVANQQAAEKATIDVEAKQKS